MNRDTNWIEIPIQNHSKIGILNRFSFHWIVNRAGPTVENQVQVQIKSAHTQYQTITHTHTQ